MYFYTFANLCIPHIWNMKYMKFISYDASFLTSLHQYRCVDVLDNMRILSNLRTQVFWAEAQHPQYLRKRPKECGAGCMYPNIAHPFQSDLQWTPNSIHLQIDCSWVFFDCLACINGNQAASVASTVDGESSAVSQGRDVTRHTTLNEYDSQMHILRLHLLNISQNGRLTMWSKCIGDGPHIPISVPRDLGTLESITSARDGENS